MGKIHHNKKWMPTMYVALYGFLKDLVKTHGYILCVHGSVIRDLDLVAVPFDEKVTPHEEVVADIKRCLGQVENPNPLFDAVGYQPHGRTCYTIECGGGGYLDISFTPSLQQAIDRIKKEESDKKEIAALLRVTSDGGGSESSSH